MTRLEASERLTKWAIKLGEFDITYEPRAAIKAQALVNFLAKLVLSFSPDTDLTELSTTNVYSAWG